MSAPSSSSATLPIAHAVLRILVVLNWLAGAAVAAFLVARPSTELIVRAFHLSPSPDAERLVMGMRAIAAVFLVAIPLHSSSSNGCSRSSPPLARATRSSPRTRSVCRRSPGACSRCSCSASSSARSPGLFRRRRNRSISTRAFRSAAGSRCSSRSCWLACSPKARSCAKTSKGRSDMAIVVKLDDVLHDRRMTLTELAASDRNDAGQSLDLEDRQGARDPLFDARGDLQCALVPAWRPSPL